MRGPPLKRLPPRPPLRNFENGEGERSQVPQEDNGAPARGREMDVGKKGDCPRLLLQDDFLRRPRASVENLPIFR